MTAKTKILELGESKASLLKLKMKKKILVTKYAL